MDTYLLNAFLLCTRHYLGTWNGYSYARMPDMKGHGPLHIAEDR